MSQASVTRQRRVGTRRRELAGRSGTVHAIPAGQPLFWRRRVCRVLSPGQLVLVVPPGVCSAWLVVCLPRSRVTLTAIVKNCSTPHRPAGWNPKLLLCSLQLVLERKVHTTEDQVLSDLAEPTPPSLASHWRSLRGGTCQCDLQAICCRGGAREAERGRVRRAQPPSALSVCSWVGLCVCS